jgi:molybdopterin-guanine dinucleotide biosynthesis protein MobB
VKVYGIVGWKNSGKTTLVERLVIEVTRRGFSVSTIKHAHHTFDVDYEGKDSFRHRAAGAREVLLASRNRWALMHEVRDDAEPPLSELLEKLSPVDLVLIEGYKRDGHAKLEAHRAETKQGLLATEDATVTAVASNYVVEGLSVPAFDLDNVAGIASFILKEVGLENPT